MELDLEYQKGLQMPRCTSLVQSGVLADSILQNENFPCQLQCLNRLGGASIFILAVKPLFICFRKAAKAAAAKASQQAAGGSYLHEHPEWILPFAIQVLAHHPEFPQQQDLEAGAAEALEPFLKMLQFTLEPLLLPLPGPSDASGVHSNKAHHETVSIFRTRS